MDEHEKSTSHLYEVEKIGNRVVIWKCNNDGGIKRAMFVGPADMAVRYMSVLVTQDLKPVSVISHEEIIQAMKEQEHQNGELIPLSAFGIIT